MELANCQILHTPPLVHWADEALHFFLDAQGPNWIATDPRGARILQWIDGITHDIGVAPAR